MELVTWRVRASDLDYLRAIHPNVNEYVRELLHAVVERQRVKGLARGPLGLGPGA